MAIFGKTSLGGTAASFSTGKLSLQRYEPKLAGKATKLTLYLQAGPNTGVLKLKGIIYADDGAGKPGARLGEGTEVTYQKSEGSKLIDLPFASSVTLPEGIVWVGVMLGGVANVGEELFDTTVGSYHAFATRTYAEGAPALYSEATTPGFDTKEITCYATVTLSAPTITSPGAQTNTVGIPINQVRPVGVNVESWSASSLPPGLSLDANSGYITGAPTTVGAPSVTLKAKGLEGSGTAEATFTWNVVAVPDVGSYGGYTAFSPRSGRLGSAGSAFNRLVAQTRTHPNSANFVTWLFGAPGGNTSGLGLAHSRNQFPTVYARNTDPQVEILDTAKGYFHERKVRIPVAAKVQSNSDKHIQIVLCPSDCAALKVPEGSTADFWQAGGTVDPSETIVYEGGGTKLKVSSSGIGNVNGALCFTGKSVASNYDLDAGVIRGPELMAGLIQHALVGLAHDLKKHPAVVYPANHSDGENLEANSPSMGQRFYLAMTHAEIDAAGLTHPFLVAVAKALADYGFYFEDTGGTAISFRTENDNMYEAFGAPGYMHRVSTEQGLSSDAEGVLLDYAPLKPLLEAHMKATVPPAQGSLPTPTIAVPRSRTVPVGSPDFLSMTGTDVTSWSATGLPPGLSMNASGYISGTPTTTGTYTPIIYGSGSGTEVEATFTYTIVSAESHTGALIPAEGSHGNPFTYPAWDLTSLQPLDPLPYKGVSFGRQINTPGSWQGMLPIADPHVQALDWQDATRTARSLLCVELFGTLIWGGILWTNKYRKTTVGQLPVGATEIGSWFGKRLQAADYSNTFSAATSPLVIVERIVNDALAVGTLLGGITLSVHEHGTIPGVVASYPGTSYQTVESIAQTLSQMGYGAGFDFSFDVAYKPGTKTPEIVLNLWYPRQGRLANETNIVLLDGDLLDWEYPVDSTQQATEVVETGSGTGGVVPATASVALPGYPLLQRTFSRSQVISESTLANMALGDLGLYSYPVVTPWIELPVPGPLNPGEFTLGDDLIWRVDPVSGENGNPRFPEGMSFEWRVNGWTCTPADAGVSKLHLDLSVPPIQTIPPPKPPGV